MYKIDFYQLKILENLSNYFFKQLFFNYKNHHENSFSPVDFQVFYLYLIILNIFTEIEIYRTGILINFK